MTYNGREITDKDEKKSIRAEIANQVGVLLDNIVSLNRDGLLPLCDLKTMLLDRHLYQVNVDDIRTYCDNEKVNVLIVDGRVKGYAPSEK